MLRYELKYDKLKEHMFFKKAILLFKPSDVRIDRVKRVINMSSGGKRSGSGRRKIGVVVNTRIEEQLIKDIEETVDGNSRAEKIRNCLRIGLQEIRDRSNESEKA